MNIAIYVLLAWNLIVFLLYGIDKRKARKGQWRIKESTLILCAFLFGGVGALLGMGAFRLKTKHTKFRELVPIAVAVNALALYGVLRYML